MGMLLTYHDGYWPEDEKAAEPEADKPAEKPKRKAKAAKADASED